MNNVISNSDVAIVAARVSQDHDDLSYFDTCMHIFHSVACFKKPSENPGFFSKQYSTFC